MKRFENKVAIVTGGAQGIGASACELFAKEGAKVVVADIKNEGQAFSDKLNSMGLDSVFYKVDVTKEQEVKGLIEFAVEKYGKLDIMCANAGIMQYSDPLEQGSEVFDLTFDVNVKGVFYCDKYAIRQMLSQESRGNIINTASSATFVARPSALAYSASKAAVKQITEGLAKIYSAEGIRINSLCPGTTETDIIKVAFEDNKALYDYSVSLHPIRRHGQPHEIANAMLFLASEEASFITGTTLLVDGGYCI